MRPNGFLIDPGDFTAGPVMSLSTIDAGASGSVTLTATLKNPLPSDGLIVIHFPHSFKSVAQPASSIELFARESLQGIFEPAHEMSAEVRGLNGTLTSNGARRRSRRRGDPSDPPWSDEHAPRRVHGRGR